MATLLGTWELGKGYGHIARLAPIAQALTARGDRMMAAVRHPATAEAAPGAPFAEIFQTPIYPAARRFRALTGLSLTVEGVTLAQ